MANKRSTVHCVSVELGLFVAGELGEGRVFSGWCLLQVVWSSGAKVDGNGSFKAQTRVAAPCLWHEPLIELIIQLWFWSRKPRRTFGRTVVMRWSMPRNSNHYVWRSVVSWRFRGGWKLSSSLFLLYLPKTVKSIRHVELFITQHM